MQQVSMCSFYVQRKEEEELRRAKMWSDFWISNLGAIGWRNATVSGAQHSHHLSKYATSNVSHTKMDIQSAVRLPRRHVRGTMLGILHELRCIRPR